jgi:hypothetical protein
MVARKLLPKMFLALYAVAACMLIVFLSSSPYEFMVGETHDGHVTTACDLPAPTDDVRDVYVPLALLPVLILFAVGAIRAIRSRKIPASFVVSWLLFAVWLYRFYLMRINC